mgnify:CR=1 FL=1
MKILFFFFFLLPFAHALAVTPTELDITDGATGKVYVYNTFDYEMEFRVSGIYEENFTLPANGVKVLEIQHASLFPGTYEDTLRIEEIYVSGFVNAIEIPVLYSGKMSYLSGNVSLLESLAIGSFLLLIFSALGFYVWKSKFKGAKSVK